MTSQIPWNPDDGVVGGDEKDGGLCGFHGFIDLLNDRQDLPEYGVLSCLLRVDGATCSVLRDLQA